MEANKIKEYLKTISGFNPEIFDTIWKKHAHDISIPGVTLASVMRVIDIFNTNGINYINGNSINFKLLAFYPEELTESKIESLQAMTNRANTQRSR